MRSCGCEQNSNAMVRGPIGAKIWSASDILGGKNSIVGAFLWLEHGLLFGALFCDDLAMRGMTDS